MDPYDELDAPVLPPSAAVLAMRKNYKMLGISQFVGLFSLHVTSIDFIIEDLEADLDGIRPGCCIPALLGKLLNTLANDRNVNSTNWIAALRRQYARRYEGINPFYADVKVPLVNGEPVLDDVKEKPVEEKDVVKLENGEESLVKEEPAGVASTSILPTPTTADAALPTPVESAADTKMEVDTDEKKEEEGEVEYTWILKELGWEDVDLETKIDAIYNICEWHMTEADRFRKHLKWEDDAAWRLEAFGHDAEKNAYYVTDDARMWKQRIPPPSAGQLNAIAEVARVAKLKASRIKIEEEVIPKKRAAGRPPPKQRGSAAKKGKKRDRSSDEEDEEDDDEDFTTATTTGTSSRPASSRRAAAAPKKKKVVKEEKVVAQPKKNARARGSRSRDEVWEEVPSEWLVKDGKQAAADRDYEKEDRERSAGASSNLTSIADEMEVDSEDEQDEEEEEEEEDDDVEPLEEEDLPADENDARPQWEREYWAEREMIEAPGFVEWETVCVTLEEWETFADQFEKSKNPDEKKLRQQVLDRYLPWAREQIGARETKRLNDIAAARRKRSTRIAVLESEQEEEARLLTERSATSSRLSRASRHQVNVVNPDGSPAAVAVPKGPVLPESRDDRIKKRADEKRAREVAAEVLLIEEAKAAAREEAIEANGGVVPAGMETPQELERVRKEEERERKKLEREEAKAKRDQLAEQKALEKALEVVAAPPPKPVKVVKPKPVYREEEEEEEEEPWYLDCEVCMSQGWNLDDGSEVISCDQCEDWQHLECHHRADLDSGRPLVDYSTVDFICARCRADPSRAKQRRDAPAPVVYAPVVKEKKAYKPREKKVPAAKPSSRQSYDSASNAYGTPKGQAQQRVQAAPAAASPQLDYAALLAMVTKDNSILLQLPENYQAHFAEKLGLDLSTIAANSIVVPPQQNGGSGAGNGF